MKPWKSVDQDVASMNNTSEPAIPAIAPLDSSELDLTAENAQSDFLINPQLFPAFQFAELTKSSTLQPKNANASQATTSSKANAESVQSTSLMSHQSKTASQSAEPTKSIPSNSKSASVKPTSTLSKVFVASARTTKSMNLSAKSASQTVK